MRKKFVIEILTRQDHKDVWVPLNDGESDRVFDVRPVKSLEYLQQKHLHERFRIREFEVAEG